MGRCKRITNGRFIHKGYLYKGYEIRNHGWYPPDKCIWWEATNVQTGHTNFHANTKRDIMRRIDEYELKTMAQEGGKQ